MEFLALARVLHTPSPETVALPIVDLFWVLPVLFFFVYFVVIHLVVCSVCLDKPSHYF
jgi:hypothetical protein